MATTEIDPTLQDMGAGYLQDICLQQDMNFQPRQELMKIDFFIMTSDSTLGDTIQYSCLLSSGTGSFCKTLKLMRQILMREQAC